MDSSKSDQADKPISETASEAQVQDSESPVEDSESPQVDAFEPAQGSTFEPTEPVESAVAVPGTLRDKAVPVERSVLERLVSGTYHDPHQVLGPHLGDGAVTLRVLRPFASTVAAVYDNAHVELEHEFEGIWVGVLDLDKVPDYRLEVTYTDGPALEVDDPYRYLPSLGDMDLHLIGEGRHEQLWTVLGAHVRRYEGPAGDSHRYFVRRLGAERAGHPADRGLQLLGRPRSPHADDGLVRGLGAVRTGRRPRYAVQVRHLRPRRHLAAEGRPDGEPGRDSMRRTRPSSTTRRTSGKTRPGWTTAPLRRPTPSR